MAKGLIEIALQLGSKLGANTSKFLGTRSNVSFMGPGPKDGMLFQKEITEFAQTDKSTKAAPSATSIMGTAAALSVEQAKGFKWNADQKYLKTILDAWSINISTAGVPATQVTAINATGTDNINDHIANAEPTG